MADELPEVTETFTADTAEYEQWLEQAAMTAQEFADANLEAKAAVDEMKDSAEEAGGVMSFTAEEWQSAADAAAEIRDKVAEAAAAEDGMRDSSVEAAGAAGHLRDEALEAAAAIGHERDEAIEASAALHEVRDAEVEAGAAGAGAGAGGISMMAVGITALIGLLAAVAPAVLAVVGALGAFGLFAYPAVKQVTGALGDTKGQLALLPAPIQQVVGQVKSLEGEWKKLSAQFTAPVAQLMSQGLGIVAGLLPKLVPLAQDGAKAAGQLMGALGKGLNSKGFSDLLTMMEQLSGPATGALIGLAGTIGGVLLNALEQLKPYALPMIKMLQELVAAAGPALTGALVFLAQVLMDVGKAITPILGPLGKFFGYLDKHPVFAQIAAGIIGMVGALRIFAGVMAIVDAVSAANPFVLIAIALVALAILVATHTHQIAAAFDVVRHAVAVAGHDIANWFDEDRHALATMAHDFAAHFDEIRHDIAQWADDVHHDADMVVDWFRELPGRILSALGNLGNLLWNEGADILRGLLNGIKSAAAPVLSFIGGIGHDISSVFSSALSILSPSRVFYQHGVNTLQGYIDGVKATAPQLLAAMRGIGGRVATGGLPGVTTGAALGTAASSAPSVHLTMPVTLQGAAQAYNTPAFYQYLQAQIQEAILRYGLNNPGTGLALATGRR